MKYNYNSSLNQPTSTIPILLQSLLLKQAKDCGIDAEDLDFVSICDRISAYECENTNLIQDIAESITVGDSSNHDDRLFNQPSLISQAAYYGLINITPSFDLKTQIDWMKLARDVKEFDFLVEQAEELNVNWRVFRGNALGLSEAIRNAEVFDEIAGEAEQMNVDTSLYLDVERGIYDVDGLRQAMEEAEAQGRYEQRCLRDDYYASIRL